MKASTSIFRMDPSNLANGYLRTACATIFLLLMPPAVTQAQDYTYTTDNGMIIITGYIGPGSVVTIPETINDLPVTSIGVLAFNSQSKLTSITIPNSVTSIGTGAFYGCSQVTNLNLSSTVINIGAGAFEKCYRLSSVTIPASVTAIRNNVFSHCIGLSSVTIGESVTNIGVLAFYGCTNLTSVRIPKSVTSLESGAFLDCTSLTRVYFLGDAPRVDQSAFYNAAVHWVYYLPGTAGWGPLIGDVWTRLWDAEVQTGDASFGVHTNQFGYSQFGFNITGTSDLVVVVEACTNLARPSWSVVATNRIGWSYFSDPDWTNFPARFYRVRSN